MHIMYTHSTTFASATICAHMCLCTAVITLAGIRTIVVSSGTVNIVFFVQVPHLSSGKLANIVLSAKNALARGMTALIAIFLWCMVLFDRVCIVGLLAFLLEVTPTLANMEKRKAGFKPG